MVPFNTNFKHDLRDHGGATGADLLNFQRPRFPIPTNVHRASLRKRSGYHKPISLHFLLLLFCHFSDFWWEGLVYCGAFARTIKRILPPWGQLSLKGELYMFWKGILTGGEMKPLTSKIGVRGAKRAKKWNQKIELRERDPLLLLCPALFHQTSKRFEFFDISWRFNPLAGRLP